MRYRYRTDEEMKDSGIEWIGKIPKEWKIIRGKFLFDNKKIKNSGAMNNVLSLTLNGVIDRDINNFEGLQPESFDGYQEFKEDNLVFKLIDLENISTSRVGLVHRDGLMSPAYIRLQKKKDINMKYYYYNYFDYYKKNIFNFLGSVGVRSALNSSDLLEMEVLNLQKQEQEKIANFLDEKTSQFDLIISKKEKLIESLEEAKKSLISEVATGKVKVVKTDDGYELVKRSSEEMKDSGVEWIGEIPEDWEYGQLKYLCSYITDGAHISPETENGVYPFLSVKDLKNGYLDFENCLLTSLDNYEYLRRNSCNPKLGDVLISKDGTIGKTVTIDYNKNFVVASSLVILTPIKEFDSKYFEYSLNSKVSQEQISSFVKGAALPRISITHLKEIIIPFTKNIEEQISIVEYLSLNVQRIDMILNKTQLQIEKLKEAKQSLISEAVTGKIEILD